MYVDPDGRDLHVAYANYLWRSPEQIKQLEMIVERLNKPSGDCACALQSQNNGDPPWKSRWITVFLDPALSWVNDYGFTDPLGEAIYINPNLSYNEMMGTIAHEGGHFYLPSTHGRFWGDRNSELEQKKFDNPDYHCEGKKTKQSLHPWPCSCD